MCRVTDSALVSAAVLVEACGTVWLLRLSNSRPSDVVAGSVLLPVGDAGEDLDRAALVVGGSALEGASWERAKRASTQPFRQLSTSSLSGRARREIPQLKTCAGRISTSNPSGKARRKTIQSSGFAFGGT